ncbi:chaperone protein ClpB [Artemisia annua]|uniref:Chaperone protein ClpB n=1 Tax=Artemisia annua TaxID=35608 RepID=A0A2U1MF36_ARTAN|nr:chaperone protein ClpB [Artemisia annua]
MLIGRTINCFGTSTKVIASLQHCVLNCTGASFDYREDRYHGYDMGGREIERALLFQASFAIDVLTFKLTGHLLPNKAIDLMDDACANMRVQLDSQPEEIDNLERKIMQLEVKLHALEKEKEFSTLWDIKATPTFLFLKDGYQFDKLVGDNKPELLKKINGIVDSESGRHM